MKTIKFLNITRKSAEWAVLFGLLCAVTLSFAHFNAACEDLRQNVLRLHIIANSDSEADQQLKLVVRDRILSEAGDIFKKDTELENAIYTAQSSLDVFEDIANRVISEYDFKYKAKALIGDSYFETREYEDFTLPAGTYKSLIVKLGKGEGKNWWCVVFPAVCVPAARGCDLSDSASRESAAIAEQPQRYIMRFKTVEWYEDLKKILNYSIKSDSK